ncbi:inward rectifier potassium channel irk-1-like isoform X4 [Periplaneta americana]|uniref:inward rectifier potassium channel irk-1-like isoform X4 n=1 Tax=Periplaneta americana TaxID=6978 RepID=UPI0037E81453
MVLAIYIQNLYPDAEGAFSKILLQLLWTCNGDISSQSAHLFSSSVGQHLLLYGGLLPICTGTWKRHICQESMENQHTTGFGVRMPTEECPEAILLLCMQGIVGVILQSIMVGLVFLKMVRPKQRTRTLEFSKYAVVCRRDGKLCFMFRVGDLRRSHIIEAKMRVLLVQTRITQEGEVVSPYRIELKVEDTSDVKSNFFCLLWPEIVVHCIDSSSPLYDMSADDLQRANFEIVVIMEGTIESTDQRVQARTSYLPKEILWGHRFESVVNYDVNQKHYNVDYSQFHNTIPVETSRLSAHDQGNCPKTPVTRNDVCEHGCEHNRS